MVACADSNTNIVRVHTFPYRDLAVGPGLKRLTTTDMRRRFDLIQLASRNAYTSGDGKRWVRWDLLAPRVESIYHTIFSGTVKRCWEFKDLSQSKRSTVLQGRCTIFQRLVIDVDIFYYSLSCSRIIVMIYFSYIFSLILYLIRRLNPRN